MKIVPDTSVLVDGRITELIREGKIEKPDIIISLASIAELEHQANAGKETGMNGLNEIIELQKMRNAGLIELHFLGRYPSSEEIQNNAIDAMIRELAEEIKAMLITSDRIQAQVAKAKGMKVQYLPPYHEIPQLEILNYFDDETMSVHLRQDCTPVAKKGKPDNIKIVELGNKKMNEKELAYMTHQIIEYARRDANSFIEMEHKGATVIQLENMRITIARQPFSDKFEITATRPIVKLSIDDYNLNEEILARLTDYNRGILISGPPGSGKSTFAQAVAEHLYSKGAIVKTMEQPRDLQVRDEISQYAPLEKKMELTADILLLVRPDFVIFDEVRRSSDFKTFADMRLAGIGLIGVTHANRAIDAIQRLIGRVELGMIPQVVDTVIHIEGGKIKEILELEFTVKIPYGMEEADLARPVIIIKEFESGKPLFEIYSYGEQVVVVPVGNEKSFDPIKKLAEERLKQIVEKYVDSPVEVEISSNRADVYVDDEAIPHLIGKAGKTISMVEKEAGIKINVKPLKIGEKIIYPSIIKRKNSIVLKAGKSYGNRNAEVFVDGELILNGQLSSQGEMKLKRTSKTAKRLMEGIASGARVEMKLL